MVELACDFGLVGSLDPIGQMAGRKRIAMQGDQHLQRNVLWTSNLGFALYCGNGSKISKIAPCGLAEAADRRPP